MPSSTSNIQSLDALFPPRPWTLSGSHRTKELLRLVVLVLVVLAMGAFMGGYGFQNLTKKWDERAIWSSGVETTDAAYDGKVKGTGKLGITFFYDYDLTVKFLTKDGTEHKEKLEFMTLFSKASESDEAVSVRYDPADPSRFALSLSAQAGLAGWAPGLAFFALGLMFLSVSVLVINNGRKMRAASVAAAADAEVLLVPMDSVVRNSNGTIEVKYHLPGGPNGEPAKFEQQVSKAIFIQLQGVEHALVVRPAGMPDQPIVLMQGLLPFEFPADESRRILDAVSARLRQTAAAA